MEALRSSGLVQAVRAVNPLYTTASLHVNSQFVTLAQAAIIINTLNAGTGFGSGARPLIIRISREAVADTVFTIPGGVLPPAGGAFGGGGRGGRRRR